MSSHIIVLSVTDGVNRAPLQNRFWAFMGYRWSETMVPDHAEAPSIESRN